MWGSAVPSLLQQVRRLAGSPSSDEQLLADYLARRSDEAFAAIVGRHGPMVLNVCRRILHDHHAAEDVFQATFLLLADRAGAVHRRASLAGFLHGVAYRLAVRARRQNARVVPAAECDHAVEPPEGLAWQEALGILDHELGRLADRYRAPLVLCYLQGRTQDEAARQLGWGINTLRRRLARGRRLLEARLRGRGVTLPAALTGLLAAGAAGVPAPLRAAILAAVSTRVVGAPGAAWSALSGAGEKASLLGAGLGKLVVVMVAVVAIGVAGCLAALLAPPADQPPAVNAPPPAAAGERAERDHAAADPLPAGAVVRFGTDRYRNGNPIASMAVSADGKVAVAAGTWHSRSPGRVFDLTDGRCLDFFPHGTGPEIEAVGVSPDGSVRAFKDDNRLYFFRADGKGKPFRSHLYMSSTGGGRSVTDWITFTPDGKRVAVTLMGNAVQLVDVATGRTIQTFQAYGAVSACVFSPDGKRMATDGFDRVEDGYFARLWDVETGKEFQPLPAGNDPGANGYRRSLAFSPDGTILAGGGWGGGRLRLWEVATGKELKVIPGSGREVESVAFAPDGKTVAAASDQVRFYDIGTGQERLRIGRPARKIAFSADGSVLTGAVSGVIHRWDTATGRQLTPSAGQDSGVEQVVARVDGRGVFTTDQEGNLYAWDANGRKPPSRIAEGVERGVVASADGRYLAWAVEIDSKHPDPTGRKWQQIASRVRLYDVAADRVVDRLEGFLNPGSVVGFLPDGKSLLTINSLGSDITVRVWDVESGRERRSFTVAPPMTNGNQGLDARALPFFSTRRAALSADGRMLAIGPSWPEGASRRDRRVPVTLWDVETGKPGAELKEPVPGPDVADEAGTGKMEMSHRILQKLMKAVDGRAFSPDGRLLADWALNPFGPSRVDHIYVWEVATGRAVATLTGGQRPGSANAAFSPDGRTLAAASADGVVRVWEVATWTVRAEFRGHRDRVTAVTFGPDGRLFTGGLDTTVIGRDVRPPRQEAKRTLAEAWDALAQTDAKIGFEAQGRFLAEPGKAVEWLAARVQPIRRPDEARIRALIADLDGKTFATRERAMAELREHVAVAAPALREVVANSRSDEARRRAEGLLKDLENGGIEPGELRGLRSVEVLEWIATAAACARLQELARGAPDARLTRDAAAACKRLEARTASAGPRK